MRFPPDRNPDHLFPSFNTKIQSVLKAMKAWCKAQAPGFTPVFGEGFRTKARQQELYAQGRTKPGPIVTQKDGIQRPSRHQTALAFDLWFEMKGTIIFEGIPEVAWNYYGHLCRAQGLEWGGDWSTFKDLPHAEWPAQDKTTVQAAIAWIRLQKLN